MRKKEPKISIVTVVKNSEDTIEATIQSVINQSYKNFEYIIIDGASSDSTLIIINKYSNHIFKVISEPDNGIYEAINKGIKIATGDLIGILNSDDRYFSNSLSIVADNYQKEIILSGYCIVANGSADQLSNREGKRFQKVKPINRLRYRMAIDHPAMFVPIEYYKKLGLYDINYTISSDYKWTANAWKNGVKFRIIDEPLVLFSRGGISDNNWIISSKENKSIHNELSLLPSYKARLYFIYRILNFIKTHLIRTVRNSI